MTINIPYESPFTESLMKGADVGTAMFQRLIQPYMQAQQLAQQYKMHMDEMPSKNMLRQAQIQDAMASAQKNQFFLNLLSGASGNNFYSGQDGNQGSMMVDLPNYYGQSQQQAQPQSQTQQQTLNAPEFLKEQMQAESNKPVTVSPQVSLPSISSGGEQVISMGNPNLAGFDKAPGIMGIPEIKTTVDADGNLIKTYPSGKITKTKVSPSQLEIEEGKQEIGLKAKRRELFDKLDAEVVQDYTKSRGDIAELGRIYNQVEADLQTPEWGKLKAKAFNRFGDKVRSIGIETYKSIGDKDTKEVIGRLESNLGRLVAEYAKVFKGAFRQGEQALLESVKPRPSEPLEVQLAKINQLNEANRFANHLAQRVPVLVRKEGYTADEAYDIALKEVNADKWFDSLQRQNLSQSKGSEVNFRPLVDYTIDELRKFTPEQLMMLDQQESMRSK